MSVNFMVDAAMRVMASSISGIKARSCDVVVVSCVESSMGGASIIQAGIARASKALVGGGGCCPSIDARNNYKDKGAFKMRGPVCLSRRTAVVWLDRAAIASGT